MQIYYDKLVYKVNKGQPFSKQSGIDHKCPVSISDSLLTCNAPKWAHLGQTAPLFYGLGR